MADGKAVGPMTQQFTFNADDLDSAVDARFSKKQAENHPLEVLVLSGGGANGAWGAGFLSGWAASGNRPKFDLVTGVSTGGLLATGAFLGNDDMLKQAFTKTTDSDVKGSRFFLFIPFSDSVYTSGPLKKLIDNCITNALIDQVAEEGAKQRRLYVASSDLDTGKLHIWNLTEIAKQKQYDFYRKVLLASASAPMIFPPVDIEGVLNGDGGVKANLFFRNKLLPSIARSHEKARHGWTATRPAQTAAILQPTIYVVVNGTLSPTYQPVQNCLIPLAERAVNCLMDSNNMGCLYETKYWARESGYRVRLCFIPDEVTPCESFTFDEAKMNVLYQAAAGYGKDIGTTNKWMQVKDMDEGTPVEKVMGAGGGN